MSYEQEIQRLTYIYRELEAQLKSLEEQVVSLETYKTGVHMTKTIIEQFKKSDEKEIETLISIGNAYVKAKIANPDNFVVAVGRDVFIEKSGTDALKWMKQLEENQNNLKTLLINKIKEISAQMNQISTQMNQFQVNRSVPGDPS